MIRHTTDMQRKSRELASLPSSDEFIRKGGQYEQVTDKPRRSAVMAAHRDGQRKKA